MAGCYVKVFSVCEFRVLIPERFFRLLMSKEYFLVCSLDYSHGRKPDCCRETLYSRTKMPGQGYEDDRRLGEWTS